MFGGEEAGGDEMEEQGVHSSPGAGGEEGPLGGQVAMPATRRDSKIPPRGDHSGPTRAGRGRNRDGSHSQRDAAGRRAGCEEDRRAMARGHLAQRFVVLFLNVSDEERV